MSLSRDHEEIYTIQIQAGSRRYFLNLKLDSKGNKYLVIKESKKYQDGTVTKHQVIVFEEDLAKIVEGLADVVKFLENQDITPAELEEPDPGETDEVFVSIDD